MRQTARSPISLAPVAAAIAVAAVTIAVLPGCEGGRGDAQSTGARPAGSAAPAAQTSTTARADEQPKAKAADASCGGIVARYDAALEKLPLDCHTDADCGCFNGGVSSKRGCGGVAGATSAAELESLRKEFAKAGCDSGINCAAWMCAPRCRGGKCENHSGAY